MTGALVALVALSGSVMAASAFTNGSFETGPVANVGAGSTIGAWAVSGGDVDHTDIWTAKEGNKSVDLNGFGPGAIEQTFATTINSTYVVQFWMSGNPGTHEQYPNGAESPSKKTMTVSARVGRRSPYSFDTAAKGNTFADMKWADKAYSFKATGATTTLRFASTTAGAFGPAIDFVTITETVADRRDCKNDGWKDMLDRQEPCSRTRVPASASTRRAARLRSAAKVPRPLAAAAAL